MKSPNGDNWPMMIIAHKCTCAKEENPRRKIFTETGSSLFTEAVCSVPPPWGDHKVWDRGRHNSSICAIFCKLNQKFSPTSTWFSTGKNRENTSFSPIINQLTEKLQNKFVTFHGYRFTLNSGKFRNCKEKCTISEGEILQTGREMRGGLCCIYFSEPVK